MQSAFARNVKQIAVLRAYCIFIFCALCALCLVPLPLQQMCFLPLLIKMMYKLTHTDDEAAELQTTK